VMTQKEEPKIIDPVLKTEESILSKDTNTSIQQVAIVSETKKQDSILTLQPNIETKTTEDVVIGKPTEELKKDTIAAMVLTEQTQESINAEKTNLNVDTLAKSDLSVSSVNNEAVFKKSQVKKYSESSTTEGFGLVYYDIYDGGRDTIRLLIPNPPSIFKTADEDSSLIQKSFIRVEELKKDTVQQIPMVVPQKNVSVQSQCKAIASGNDFFKLRKNMASEETDEDMVVEAKKFFKTKCFSTEQIKNLGALFLTSAGKYQFFDAAYLHISDQENFSSLEAELKDEYYLKRFKALIGE
jgi:hypothetical protein